MKIKKISQAVGLVAKVLNLKSNSTQDTYSCDYINNKDNELLEKLGDIQIISIQYKVLASSNIATQGTATVSDTFTAVEGADGYIAIPINYNWVIPTGVTITGNILKCTLLNPFGTTKDGNCKFLILGYKNK